MKHIAIMASGAGSNAEKIIDYFKGHSNVKIVVVLSNKAGAGVIGIAQKNMIPTEIITTTQLKDELYMMGIMKNYQIDLIVLAGFLLRIPEYLVSQFQNKIVNIHPSLLPLYGGKGMYGHYVHEAVFKNKDTESGISIHYVNAQYDEGDIIFQKRIDISHCKSPDEIASAILEVEHSNYAQVIEDILKKQM